MKVYKLYYFCDDSAETKRYIFEQIELLTEKMLRARFKQAIIDEQYGDRYPDMKEMVDKFDQTIEEMYNLMKQIKD